LTNSQSEFEPVYVVDTNALIWHLTGHHKLSKAAKAIFEAAKHGETRLVVSSITLAEMFFSDQKYGHFDDFKAVYEELKARPEYEFLPYYPEDVLDLADDSAVPEMHDRMIAGLARRLDVPLVTSDGVIAESGIVRVIW
jgi:PIN domain nuclease of toxin-antitoxin system